MKNLPRVGAWIAERAAPRQRVAFIDRYVISNNHRRCDVANYDLHILAILRTDAVRDNNTSGIDAVLRRRPVELAGRRIDGRVGWEQRSRCRFQSEGQRHATIGIECDRRELDCRTLAGRLVGNRTCGRTSS